MRSLLRGGGIEIVETRGFRHAFTPHRHDSYVIGITEAGIQRFRYRHAQQQAAPGEAFVIHPDEIHDGAPGTPDGYGYRAAYIAPHLIGAALGGGTLPFVPEAVGRNRSLLTALRELLLLPEEEGEERDPEVALAALSDILARMSGAAPRALSDRRALLLRIRDQLAEECVAGTKLARIEQAYGIDRFTLARLFRRYFGVGPRRFQTLRRLDRAQSLIRRGAGLADVAAASGFADQSHLTRQFRRAFGITPGDWRRLIDQ